MSRTIAVVGAGIAGAGAAWALHRAGFEVTVFEANPEVGGNAKTHRWSVGDREIVTGLSVLAWPRRFFKNYERLVRELGVETEDVDLRFFIRRGEDTFEQGRESSLGRRYAADLARWRRLVSHVASVNDAVHRSSGERSLYHGSPLNPLNYIPLRALSGLFGVSSGFWEEVLIPLYSSSFLTAHLDGLPAVILPVLDAMLSVENGGTMATWSGSSVDVFTRLLAGLEGRIHTGCPIVGVSHEGPRQRAGVWGRLRPHRDDGPRVVLRDGSGASHTFDEVVFACNATSLARALERPTWLQRELLSKITYADDDDASFLVGHVHGDATVLPERHRETILRDFCTYVEVVDDGRGGLRYENHFVLSSWVPAAQGAGKVMLVHYHKPDHRALDGFEKTISNRRAHPAFSAGNLARSGLMRLIQGQGHLHYCGSYTTPGNGHDLSLLSGLVVANAIGAPYPFPDSPEALADFDRLRRFMLGG